ncbi:MAG: GNAT family N-acetyltransferase [Planctomycetia bacterium]|nr:GNAT family N-acetyltransferase [Planctomycetia bacterium]
MLVIRDATSADASRIVDFNSRMAWETEHKRLDPVILQAGVDAALRQPLYARYFVAESSATDQPELIGQLMITYEWSDWRNGLFWWIQSVYVREENRRSGVFRMLLDHVAMLARETPGTCGLRLYVEHENQAAIKTYERLGFAASGHVLYEIDWSQQSR